MSVVGFVLLSPLWLDPMTMRELLGLSIPTATVSPSPSPATSSAPGAESAP